MEWMLDPSAWVGLLTLVVLEIVLGIDNLIFIAILVEKLPPALRDRARVLGLSLALLMRLVLLSVMSRLIKLTAPLFAIGPLEFRSEEHTSALQSLMRTSYAVFFLTTHYYH